MSSLPGDANEGMCRPDVRPNIGLCAVTLLASIGCFMYNEFDIAWNLRIHYANNEFDVAWSPRIHLTGVIDREK